MDNTARSLQKDATANTVAANLAAELTRQRWSARKAATALGLTHVYVTRRTSGEVECSASDLAMFSEFLDIPVGRFFDGLNKKSPASEETGLNAKKPQSVEGLGLSLPDLDSNQEPAGTWSAASIREIQTPLAPVTPLRPVAIPLSAPSNKTAIVTMMKRGA